MAGVSLEEMVANMDNSLLRDLKDEDSPLPYDQPRMVAGAHYTIVKPKPVDDAFLVAGSGDCAKMLGLDPAQFKTEQFAKVFGGISLLDGQKAWATVYGCHHYGHWFGQLGDGRAMSIGEVVGPSGNRYELQLKGAGPTPFSRRFDGRAVLRSSIREFLASESLYHLNVPGTRALCILGTSDTILRAWYPETAANRDKNSRPEKSMYPPNIPKTEPGAVMCRVAPSFLRFAHLELFWKRGEFTEMAQLADHAIAREFPEIETKVLRGMSKGEAYCEMFEEMSRRMAKLVAEWLRVGYVQGNMNSDNTAIGGHTIDFGPFGIMEEFDPLWTPFTSDGEKKFSFAQQPQAGAVNIGVMHEAITALVEHACEGDAKLPEYKKRIQETYRVGYAKHFQAENSKNRRAKLGLVNSGEVADGIWKELMRLMGPSVSGQGGGGVDYTIFFRLLSDYDPPFDGAGATGFDFVRDAFYEVPFGDKEQEWHEWFINLADAIIDERANGEKRLQAMKKVNPKYIMRNWMMTEAYERAEEGDYSMVHELLELLQNPYDEQSNDMHTKYFTRTPDKYRMMPGVSFMS